jgi:glycosyltransferase involved in cell wall biosynthesis
VGRHLEVIRRVNPYRDFVSDNRIPWIVGGINLKLPAPLVTVLMPVYNGEKYLKEAIESILDQTYQNLDFLIMNDGSTDNSLSIIESYEDPRIRVITNETNLKLIATLNKGLQLAKGKYVARMDCDDISVSNRIEKQIEFMENNPEVGICGAWVTTIGEKTGYVWKYDLEYDDIKATLLFKSAFAHPTVMMRTSLLREHNLYYDENFVHAEDYEFWQRCSNSFPVRNIPLILLRYISQHNE